MRLLRGAASWAAPALASWLPLIVIRAIHRRLLFGELDSWAWVFLPIAAVLAFESAATWALEVRQYGWRRQVWAGWAVRCLSLAAYCAVFLGLTLRARGTSDIHIPLIRLWPYLARICWQASPLPAACAAVLILLLYGMLTVRRRLFRLSTTVLLPALATLMLFRLLYFHPASPLRTLGRRRPAAVEQLLPQPRYAGLESAFGAERFRFSRDLYVAPDDAWVMASFGATYSSRLFGRPDNNGQPNLLWAELRGTRYQVFRSDPVHRFSSECPEKLYFAPWNAARFYEYEPGAPALRAIDLPKTVLGQPVEELYSAYYACRRGRVYLSNNRNPTIFAWDAVRRRLVRTLPLAGLNGIQMGDVVLVVKRNPVLKTLLVGLPIARQNIVEIDEESLAPRRFAAVPEGVFNLALSPDGRWLYATAIFTGEILKLDADTLRTAAHLPAPWRSRGPWHCHKLDVSPDGRWLYAGSYYTGEVAVYDTATDRLVLSFYATPKVAAVHATVGYLYVLGAEGLFRVSAPALEAMIRAQTAPR